MPLKALTSNCCSSAPRHATWTTVHRSTAATLVTTYQKYRTGILSYSTRLRHSSSVSQWPAVAQQQTLSCSSRVVALPASALNEDTFLYKLKNGLVSEALQQFESICALGVYPSNNSCQRFIAGLCKRKRYQEAWRAFAAIETSGVRLNAPVAHMLCRVCLQSQKPERALRVYRSYLRATGEPANVYLATTIISHLLRLPSKGRPHRETAYELWRQLLGSGQALDAAAYRAGINVLVEMGLLAGAEGLLASMQAAGTPPGTRELNMVLKYHCKRGDVAAAQRLIKRMRTLGTAPDSVTYNTLMQVFVAGGELVRARAVLDKARREGCAVDVVSYTCLLKGLARAHQAEAAEQLLLEMQQHGVRLNSMTYGTLANLYAEMGRPDMVRGVLRRMQQAGLAPSAVLYNTLLKAVLRSWRGRSTAGSGSGNSTTGVGGTGTSSSIGAQTGPCLVNAGRPTPSTPLSSSRASTTLSSPSSPSGPSSPSSPSGPSGPPGESLASEVADLLRDMARQGHAPGVDSYTLLIDALLGLHDPGSASRVFEQLLQQGLQPDGVLLTCLMKLHVASGEPLAAIKAFNQISSSPAAAVDLPAWCALVDALARAGRMQEAKQAAERAADYAAAHAMPAQACEPAFGALIKGYQLQRQVGPAVAAFRRFVQLGGRPNAAMCAYVVGLCAAAGEEQTARQVIRAAELMGVQPDQQQFEQVLQRYQLQREQRQRVRQQQQMGHARRGSSSSSSSRRPGPRDSLERWKWWLGLPNKYYSPEWK